LRETELRERDGERELDGECNSGKVSDNETILRVGVHAKDSR
jgi:hypothetical protein